MPPSSRKRNKGKERKAKQQAKKEENERVEANRIWRNLCMSTGCDHGCVAILDDHPVSSFMDQFYINLHHREMTMGQTLREIFKTHKHIWNNESYRKSALDILVHIGTNMLLHKEVCDLSWPLCLAQCVMVLEHFNDSTDDVDVVMNKRAVKSKLRNLECNVNSIKRDLLKFYRKRVSCKCLKKMHLETRKTIPKMGICWHCKDEKERVHLSVCSRCMVGQYCSRECQISAWPEHERRCDEYVKANRTR